MYCEKKLMSVMVLRVGPKLKNVTYVTMEMPIHVARILTNLTEKVKYFMTFKLLYYLTQGERKSVERIPP